MTFIESYYQQCTKGFSYYKNHYAKVTIISSQNKSFLAHNWILLTSPTARYKIILLYFTTFSSNKNLFLSALRASRNKFNYDSCKTFILAFDYYHLRIIIITYQYLKFISHTMFPNLNSLFQSASFPALPQPMRNVYFLISICKWHSY